MYWDECESILRSYIEDQWALSAFSAIPLVFENETIPDDTIYILVDIEGTFSEKAPYSSVGNRLYIEYGIIYFHCFAPSGEGKSAALAPVVALKNILELKKIQNVIETHGANPPSPAEQSDNLLPDKQPGGNYYRVSASVPFCLIGS